MSLKDKSISMPFMQFAKITRSQKYEKDSSGKWVEAYDNAGRPERARIHLDNGRVLAMVDNDEVTGWFECFLDNRTLKIIQKQYNIRYQIIEVIRFKTAKIPEEVACVIDEFFKAKSDYKIIHQKYEKEYGEFDERTLEAAFRLLMSKKSVNGLYGVFATFPLRDEIDLDFERLDDHGQPKPFKITKKASVDQYDELLDE